MRAPPQPAPTGTWTSTWLSRSMPPYGPPPCWPSSRARSSGHLDRDRVEVHDQPRLPRRREGVVAVAGRCVGDDDVVGPRAGAGRPARRFLCVVARFAEALAV